MSETEALSYEIELSVDIKNSISHYFDFTQKVMAEFDVYLNRYRELDFLRMRRFLNTTYRTLTELDSQFMATKLKDISGNLNRVVTVYDLFMRKSTLGRHSFDKIFLVLQEDFLVLEKQFESNKEKITLLEARVGQLKDTYRRHHHRLTQTNSSSEDHKNQTEILRKLKTQINEALKEREYLHKDNMLVDKALMSFLRAYKEPFSEAFSDAIHQMESKLVRILNVMAFEFDIELWHKAKESKIINEYFKEFAQGRVVSSQLYLEYYLKNLNHANLRQEDKELQQLLLYLKTIEPITIVVLMPNLEDLKLFKLALESDNSGFEILCFNNPRTALKSAFTQAVDLFILDMELGDAILENFMLTYKKHLSQGEQKKAKLMLVSDIVSNEMLQKAKALQADSIIEHEVEAVEIIDSVYTLIKL